MLGTYLELRDVTLLWCLQDGGDPAVDVSPRDIVYTLPADQASSGRGPQQLAQTDLRYAESSRTQLISHAPKPCSSYLASTLCYPQLERHLGECRSKQVCLASSDLLHMHLALAGTRFNCYCCYHYCYYHYYLGVPCRCNGIAWGSDELALLYESEWKTRRSVVSTFAPSKPGQGSKVLFDR